MIFSTNLCVIDDIYNDDVVTFEPVDPLATTVRRSLSTAYVNVDAVMSQIVRLIN